MVDPALRVLCVRGQSVHGRAVMLQYVYIVVRVILFHFAKRRSAECDRRGKDVISARQMITAGGPIQGT